MVVRRTASACSPICRTHSALMSWLFTSGGLWGATAIYVALRIATVRVPFLRDILGTVPLSPADLRVLAVVSLTPVAVMELSSFGNAGRGGRCDRRQWRARPKPYQQPVRRVVILQGQT